MTIAYADFIGAFPEFSNATTYPQSSVDFWITQAYAQLNPGRLRSQLDLAAMLFTAHNVVLSAREAAAAAAGQIVGEVKGPVTAKAIDKVSVSFSDDTGLEGAGPWNFTTYGQRLYRMLKSYNSGPMYVPGRRRFLGL